MLPLGFSSNPMLGLELWSWSKIDRDLQLWGYQVRVVTDSTRMKIFSEKELRSEVTLFSYNWPVCDVAIFEGGYLFDTQYVMNHWSNQLHVFHMCRKKVESNKCAVF